MSIYKSLMLSSSQITRWTDVSPKLLKRSLRRVGNYLLSITNAAQTTSLLIINSHLHGVVMFQLWIKQTCTWLHPDCGTLIVLALGIISVMFVCLGELHASILFSSIQLTFSGYLGTWKGGKTYPSLIVVRLQSIRNLAEINCCWSQHLTHF